MQADIAPFGHMVWTGVVCIVAWSEWQRLGRFRLTRDVLATLVIVMGLHSINDFISFESAEVGALFLLGPVVPVISYLFFKHRVRELTPPEQVLHVPPGWRPRAVDAAT